MALLDAGRIVQSGTLEHLLTQPASESVAAFFGITASSTSAGGSVSAS
ncbi:MAG: hypothetical protein JOY70_06665 [Acidisphaera sp.]|nr:hypothetical protein [Acidisphaera sp.]